MPKSLILQAGVVCLALAADDPPPTPKKPVVDEYHGVKITDDYRWLENGAASEVREWSDQQNARTRGVLDPLANRAAIIEQLNRLYKAQSASFSSLIRTNGPLFAIESQPPKLQSFLVTLGSTDDPASAHAVVDPNAIDAGGGTSIDFYVPSHDGKLVAVSMSKN